MSLLELHQLSLSIGEKEICHHLDWRLESNQVWGVLGVNGVGKSTLLRAIAGLYPVESGEIRLGNRALTVMSRRQIARRVGLVFQHQDDIFPATVLEQVMIGRHPHTALLRGEQPEDRQIVQQAITLMGLEGLEQRSVDTLSGGERRRVAIATILAQQPQLYLLDEPEAHLDPRHQKVIFERVVTQLQQQQAAGVMALHDINLALHHCTHLLMLLGDGVVEQGPVAEMATLNNMERLYGTEMVQLEQQGRIAFLPK